MKKKLKIGYKDRSAKEVEVDGVTFLVKPMSQIVMTSLAMFSNGIRSKLLTQDEKKEFVMSHIVGWKDMYFDDGSRVDYTDELAVEYLLDEDYDDLFMLLYWKSIEMANDKQTEIEKNKEVAKK